MPLSEDPPCQAEACAIQTCLQRYSYNQDKCDDVLNKLYACCSEMYKRNPRPKGMSLEEEADMARQGKGEKGHMLSTACPMRTVVERKMKQLGQQQEDAASKQ